MIHLFAFYDRKAEVWVGKTEGLPIKTEAATLDELVAKVWEMAEELTKQPVPRIGLLLQVADREGLSSSDTLHLMSSPANARELDEAIAEIEAGNVTEFRP
jgi:hypothetical protein